MHVSVQYSVIGILMYNMVSILHINWSVPISTLYLLDIYTVLYIRVCITLLLFENCYGVVSSKLVTITHYLCNTLI